MLETLVNDILRPLWGLWLMMIFLGIVAWAFWPTNKKRFEADAEIPFKDEDKEREDGFH